MKTSPGESTTTIRPEYFGAISKKSLQVFTSSVTTLVRIEIPVVPQSFGSWYSSFGSHQRPLNCGLMYFAFGIFDQSIFSRKPSLTMSGVHSAVGQQMSYWPIAPPLSFENSSSFDG